jgi:phospho-N-acetylmuramoyl-pentapeptide-transferase
MLYWLYRHLDFNLFQYTTIRAGIGFFIGLFLTMWLMPKFIAWAKAKNASQPIYDLAPDSHQAKAKTPTMGGLVFVIATIIATIFCAKLNNPYVIVSLVVIIGYALIGFKDDYAKITNDKNDAGLTPRQKLILQFVVAGIASVMLYIYGFLTQLYVPFVKAPLFDMHLFAIGFWALVIVATSNAVNLTDGLDGLATFPSILAFFTLSIIVYVTGHVVIANYLLMPNINGVSEVVIIGISLAGSLIGFLWYNSYPAEVFMGDTGSLTLGAFMGYMAIICKSELLLILIGIIFVVETLSVILQVGSFKTRGKRVFLMAPIHHHFEMKGWVESKIIVRFWMVALIANIIALITLKVR